MINKSPFAVLEKTITILLVDDDKHVLDFYEEIVSGHPLLRVVKATTSFDAENLIRTEVPHICFIDMGIDDVHGDEFYLIKKYSCRLPCIVISGSMDIEKAFMATIAGAAAMIAKPFRFDSETFWNIIAQVFVDKCIVPYIPATANSVLHECCRILSQDFPENVSVWANKVGITDAYLRKIWSESSAYSPKQLLFMYKLYRDAFAWTNEWYLAQINDTVPDTAPIDIADIRQHISYYILNRQSLAAIRDKYPPTQAIHRMATVAN